MQKNFNMISRIYEGQEIRVVDAEGEPWFINNDVCAILEIGNPRDALSRLDDDEKDVVTTDTLGGPQQTSIVNFPGLLKLIATSRKPEAKAFDKWVRWEIVTPVLRGRALEMPATNERTSLTSWLSEVRKGHRAGGISFDEFKRIYRSALWSYGLLATVDDDDHARDRQMSLFDRERFPLTVVPDEGGNA